MNTPTPPIDLTQRHEQAAAPQRRSTADEHECPECGAEYTSRLAAEECGEFDRTERKRQREYTRSRRATGDAKC